MDVEILWKLLTRLAERDDDADCVPHIVLIAEDARVILAEVSRLRQDLSTAIERAAKWLQDEAANELDAARKAEAAGFEHIARLHYSRCGAYEIAMPAILALKTESSNEQ
jgi:hypothetical protein